MIPTFSPQGDGNNRENGLVDRFENAVDPYLFPARGRKPHLKIKECLHQALVDPYLFPARGRKPEIDV